MSKCNVKIDKKCNNMSVFESGHCNKYETFIVKRDFSKLLENLPFHRVMHKETDHPVTSSNIKIPEQTFPENDPEWKVFKNKQLFYKLRKIKYLLDEPKPPFG